MARVLVGFLVVIWFASCSRSDGRAATEPSADSIAALRALDPSQFASGDSVDVLGFYSPGDGGGGSFLWNPTDTSAESSGLTIAPTSGDGRWNRVYDQTVELTVLAIGAVPDGVTDNSSLLSVAACKSGMKFYFPTGSYLLSTVVPNTQPYYRPSSTDGSPQAVADPYTRMMLCQGASNFTWRFESDAFLIVDANNCRSTGVAFDRDHDFQLLNGPNIKGCRAGLGQVENVAMLMTSDTDFLVDGIKCVEGLNGGACIAADWIANGTIRNMSAPNIAKAFDVAFLWNITIESGAATGLNADGVSVGVNFFSLFFDYPNQYNNFSGLADSWPSIGSSEIQLTNNTASNFLSALDFLTGQNVVIDGNTLCDNPGRTTTPAQGPFPMLAAQAGYGVTISYHDGGTSFPSNGRAPDMFSFDGNTICRNGSVQQGGGIFINAASIPTDGSDSDMLGTFMLTSGDCSANNDKCLNESGLSKITSVVIGPNWNE